MKISRKMLMIILTAIGILFVFGVYQYFVLKKAHGSFENYYTFRGCVQLIKKTDDYGFCKINSGQTIKIVKFQNQWYLDGDLPPKF